MIAVADKLQSRLTMQTVEIAPNTAIRSLDWDRTALTLNLGSKTALLTTHFCFVATKQPLMMNFANCTWVSLVGLIDPAKLITLIILYRTRPQVAY